MAGAIVEVVGDDGNFARLDPASFTKMMSEVTRPCPNMSIVTTTRRAWYIARP